MWVVFSLRCFLLTSHVLQDAKCLANRNWSRLVASLTFEGVWRIQSFDSEFKVHGHGFAFDQQRNENNVGHLWAKPAYLGLANATEKKICSMSRTVPCGMSAFESSEQKSLLRTTNELVYCFVLYVLLCCLHHFVDTWSACVYCPEGGEDWSQTTDGTTYGLSYHTEQGNIPHWSLRSRYIHVTSRKRGTYKDHAALASFGWQAFTGQCWSSCFPHTIHDLHFC